MSQTKIGIVLIIIFIISLIMACFSGDSYWKSRELESNSQEKAVTQKEETIEVTEEEKEEEAELTPTDPEDMEQPPEGAPQEETYIDQVKMELTDLSEDTENHIKNMEDFEYEVKRYLYEHDLDNVRVVSLNIVTFYYDQSCCEFMLQTEEGEDGQVFCIRQDLDGTSTYLQE